MGRGTLGVPARQARLGREGARGWRSKACLRGTEGRADAGESAREWRRIAMDFAWRWENGKWGLDDSSEGFRGLSEMFGLFGLQ
jgi:hypothetical protein